MRSSLWCGYATSWKVIRISGADSVHIAANADERMLIWAGRKCAFSAIGRLSPDYLVQDGVVPRTQLQYVSAAPCNGWQTLSDQDKQCKFVYNDTFHL